MTGRGGRDAVGRRRTAAIVALALVLVALPIALWIGGRRGDERSVTVATSQEEETGARDDLAALVAGTGGAGVADPERRAFVATDDADRVLVRVVESFDRTPVAPARVRAYVRSRPTIGIGPGVDPEDLVANGDLVPIRTVNVDARGRTWIPRVASDDERPVYALIVEAASHGDGLWYDDGSGLPEEIEIALEPVVTERELGTVTLRGVVVDARGAPVEHYVLCVAVDDEERPNHFTQVPSTFAYLVVGDIDHQPVFEVDDPEGTFEVVVPAVVDLRTGIGRAGLWARAVGRSVGYLEIDVEPSAARVVDGLEIVLEHDFVPLRGIVVAADDGAPVEDARIEVGGFTPDARAASFVGDARTGADGRFELASSSFGDGRHLRLLVEHHEFAPLTLDLVREGDDGELVVELDRPRRVEGVLRLGGVPLPNRVVVATLRRDVPPTSTLAQADLVAASAVTDAEGRFVFDGDLPSGELHVFASLADELDRRFRSMTRMPRQRHPATRLARVGTIPAGAPAGPLELDVDLGTTVVGSVAGARAGIPQDTLVLVDREGRAVAGHDLVREGRFELKDVPPGRYTIRLLLRDTSSRDLGTADVAGELVDLGPLEVPEEH
ncbi:MAG: hypothetical protein R3F34_18840 [Planctomycetota bacterium]